MSGSARPNNTAITAVSKRAGHAKPNHACINVLAGLNGPRAPATDPPQPVPHRYHHAECDAERDKQ